MCTKSGYIEMCVDESENESCRSEKWINRGKQHMVCVNTEAGTGGNNLNVIHAEFLYCVLFPEHHPNMSRSTWSQKNILQEEITIVQL